jgi:hypothetical protein
MAASVTRQRALWKELLNYLINSFKNRLLSMETQPSDGACAWHAQALDSVLSAHTQTCALTDTRTRACTHEHTDTRTHRYAHTCPHTQRHMRAHMHTQTRNTCLHTHSHRHMHTQHRHPHTCLHTHAHMCMHTDTRAHTDTCTRTHTWHFYLLCSLESQRRAVDIWSTECSLVLSLTSLFHQSENLKHCEILLVKNPLTFFFSPLSPIRQSMKLPLMRRK